MVVVVGVVVMVVETSPSVAIVKVDPASPSAGMKVKVDSAALAFVLADYCNASLYFCYRWDVLANLGCFAWFDIGFGLDPRLELIFTSWMRR